MEWNLLHKLENKMETNRYIVWILALGTGWLLANKKISFKSAVIMMLITALASSIKIG